MIRNWHSKGWRRGLAEGLRALCALLLIGALAACSSTKHVPDGEYLLDSVDIDVDGETEVDRTELAYFLRQQPNHKVLGFAKLSLATYNLAGRDTTKWYNRWLRRVGQPPVIYDSDATEGSRRQLLQAMVNSGYMDAAVAVDTIADSASRHMDVRFTITPGEPRRIESVGYNIPDPQLRALVMAQRDQSDLRPGILFNRTVLDNERTRITRQLQNQGYYRFNREFVNFTADTVAGSKLVGLTVNVHSPSTAPRQSGADIDSLSVADGMHHVYFLRKVSFVIDRDIDPANTAGAYRDTVEYKGKSFIYGRDPYLRPSVLNNMCYLNPGDAYSGSNVERTYEALGRLAIVKFINIDIANAGSIGDIGLLDATIYLSRNKKQSISAELEGTNSEGDLGFGVGLGYNHRNLARGSEEFSAKFRASYESLSGKFDGLINKRYTEYAGEVGITFPQFICPFLTRSYKQRILASTEFALSFNYQERPEYTRIIAGGAWKWKWQQKRQDGIRRQTYDLVDINYVRLPRSTIDFIDQIAPSNPLLRYSYEDHFIMRMGYTYNFTNRRIPDATALAENKFQPIITTIRASVESAGNLLYGISNAAGMKKRDGVYKIFGIQYAQYVKGEVDYTITRHFDRRNSLSFHVGAGIEYPYGNSSMVPFEKRFYAGGANGVRGWGVRTLGPGRYDARNSVTDFINQCGDIRLDLSLEYRAKLFWVLEGALFIDAGNIWTIKEYETQPGGMFHFDSFYKEIAAAYGIGLRMDFTYFLLRLDLGFKAHNPAMNQERWPIVHPKWHRDANFHFAVGYPF